MINTWIISVHIAEYVYTMEIQAVPCPIPEDLGQAIISMRRFNVNTLNHDIYCELKQTHQLIAHQRAISWTFAAMRGIEPDTSPLT